ncbi:MAG: glycosyltransferase family 39 protein [Chloroflexi bacterium]|nr:glycosyltransferase family 39 protein [Chloroflexota bacterium]MCI0725307.1 glycosyltransferase family 39 protein [Chloroflexota bacterium]
MSFTNKNSLIIFTALFVIFTILFVANIGGWLMHDDEGTDLYEAWQLQQGKRPGVDFIAEQQPLFLLVGKASIDAFGRVVWPMRSLAALQLLLGALALSLAVYRVFGARMATLTLLLTLTSGLLYEQARLFRPDPMMLGWEMAGLAAVILATSEQKRMWWAIAGFCYGMSILWKLFGVFPVAGLGIYFLDLFWRQRDHWRETFLEGLFFAVPFLLASVGVSALLYQALGFYYPEIFMQHAQLGQQNSIITQFGKMVFGYLFFLLVNAIFIFLVPLWLLNRPRGWSPAANFRLLVWQLVVPVVFLFITRPIYLRYFLFLVPVFAILLAWQLDLAFSKLTLERPNFSHAVPLLTTLIAGFALLTGLPSVPELLLRQERDTLALAGYVASLTGSEDKVLSDYAGINFFAGRESIYEASIIAGAQIDGGIITGQRLIERIEGDRVKVVLVHVEGGDPPPHQIVDLIDYSDFREYLAVHFKLLSVFDRAEQKIEVYLLDPDKR